MSLSKLSTKRQAKEKRRKERWEGGQSNLQKAALWIKKKRGYTSESKGIVSRGIAKFGEDVEKKQAGATKKAQKTSRKSRALMTKAQRKAADRAARLKRSKAKKNRR